MMPWCWLVGLSILYPHAMSWQQLLTLVLTLCYFEIILDIMFHVAYIYQYKDLLSFHIDDRLLLGNTYIYDSLYSFIKIL